MSREYLAAAATDRYPTDSWAGVIVYCEAPTPKQYKSCQEFLQHLEALNAPALVVTEGTHRTQACLEAYREKKITWNSLPCRILHHSTTPEQRQKIGRSFNEAHDRALKSLYGEKLEAYFEDMKKINESRVALNKSLSRLARYEQQLNPASKYDSLVLELNPLRLPEKAVTELIQEFKRNVAKECLRIAVTSVTVPYRGPFHFLSDLADDLCNDLVVELRSLPDVAEKPGAGQLMKASKKSANKKYFETAKTTVTLKHLWRGYLFYNAAVAVCSSLRQNKGEPAGKSTSKGKGKTDLFTVCRNSQTIERLAKEMLPSIRQGAYDPPQVELLDRGYDDMEGVEWLKNTLHAFVRDMLNKKVQSKNSVLVEFPKWTGQLKYQEFFKAWHIRPWAVRVDAVAQRPVAEKEVEESDVEETEATERKKKTDYWSKSWTHSSTWSRDTVGDTVQLHLKDFFSQGDLKPDSVALFLVDQPFGVFQEETDVHLTTEQQTKLWSIVQRSSLQSGAVSLSYCSWHGFGASAALQQEAVAKTANNQQYKALDCSPVLLYWIPPSSGAPSKQKSLRPVDLCKPILLVHTASAPVENFHTHLDKSPDVKWATNIFQGYTKGKADKLPVPEGSTLVQKPLSLTVEFILRYTDPGDLVCVPFAGTGTEVVAALLTGRRVVAFEKDASRFALCQQRVNAVLASFRSATGPLPRFRFPTAKELEEERNDLNSAFRWPHVEVRSATTASSEQPPPVQIIESTTPKPKPKKAGAQQKRHGDDPFKGGSRVKRPRVVVQDLEEEPHEAEADEMEAAEDAAEGEESDSGGTAPDSATDSATASQTLSQLPSDVAAMAEALNSST